VEVIVVDDCSSDGTLQWLQASYPQVICRKTRQRSGPGLARNLGVQAATGSYFLPLDSDCYIDRANPQWLIGSLEQSPQKTYLFPCLRGPKPVVRRQP
jgi:glycosyltransferase involved in cell wall biosynthesis